VFEWSVALPLNPADCLAFGQKNVLNPVVSQIGTSVASSRKWLPSNRKTIAVREAENFRVGLDCTQRAARPWAGGCHQAQRNAAMVGAHHLGEAEFPESIINC